MCPMLIAILFISTPTGLILGDDLDNLQVGVQPDGRIVVPTNQILKPAGKQVLFPGRPVDLAFTDDGKSVVVKNMKNLVFIDLASGEVKQTLASRVGFSVVGLVVHGDHVYASDVQNSVQVAVRGKDDIYKWAKPISLTKPRVGKFVHPAGMALMGNDKLLVCSTRGNNVQVVDLKSGKVEAVVDVGVAPYMPCVLNKNRIVVSNWGGDRPRAGDPQSASSGTPIRIDPNTGIAAEGTVSVLEKVNGQWRQTKTIRVGLHPCAIACDGRGPFLFVANANSDTVSVIGLQDLIVRETISCRPANSLPFGSGSNALVQRGMDLYVANGTNNCIAKLDVAGLSPHAPIKTKLLGLIPTGWYPGAVLVSPDESKLIVANIKGHGSLAKRREPEKGKNSRDHLGSISIIDIPESEQLAKYTQQVNENNRFAHSIAGLAKPRKDVRPTPTPQRHGEPSVIKHVVYIIKENRTYDQVLGDMKEGNGDPKLCIFGEEITPNHHALARQFTLFDNFYCSGVLSADGHQWVNEAYVTDYLERSFGGFSRSYPFDGGDALAYASSGFLWDNALTHKKTLRNYGEFVKTTYGDKKVAWSDVYNDFKSRAGKIKIISKATVHTLEPHTHPGFPAFQLDAPDVLCAPTVHRGSQEV